MSNKGQEDRAYPRSEIEESSYYLFPLGGKGGIVCPVVLGATSYKYYFDVTKFLVHNRKIIFNNRYIDPFTDGGPDMYCSHSSDVRQPWWLAFSTDGNLTDQEIIDQDMMFNESTPFEIEVSEDKLPQPLDANWDNKIWVHIYWGDINFVDLTVTPTLEIIKHDYDIRI